MKININKKLIPIKIHYFCFLGGASTVIPFLMVIAVQLGIPVSISGTVNAASLLLVLVYKPAMAAVADTFPHHRRAIFLLNISAMALSFVAIYFVPSMQEIPKLQGQLVKTSKHNTDSNDFRYLFSGRNLRRGNDEGCHLAAASECLATCGNCSIDSQRFNLVALTPSDEDNLGKEENLVEENIGEKENNNWKDLQMNTSDWSTKGPPEEVIHHYWVEGLTSSDQWENISIECARPEWVGPSCRGMLGRWEFWVFAILLIAASCCHCTTLSITDAIIMDTIGRDGNYGANRAWGTIGWGTIAPISGLIVDWFSGSSLDKNLAPAFITSFILYFFDVLLAAAFIKVPQIKAEKPVLDEVWPLFRKPHFLVFCFFVIINGMFDGFCVYFLLLMQEDKAKGTSAMNNLRFLQGLTLFVQCSFEAPLMFVNHWFMRRFGAQRVLSAVFLMYTVRMFALAAVGMWGPVWATLLVELLNGPCYGLGFTAVVVYSASVSPLGTNTTVQSLVNVLYENVGYGLSLFLGGLMCDGLGCPTMYFVLGATSVVVFILHAGSSFFIPSLDANKKKTQQVNGDQDVQKDARMDKDEQTSEIKQRVSKKDNIIEETRL